ncbi:MAG: hypothetical protein Q9226_002148 [Calogaya cf. arnoldii]
MSADSPAGTTAAMFRELDDLNFFTPWRDYPPSLNPANSWPESSTTTTDSAGFTNPSTVATTPSSTPTSPFPKDSEPMQLTAASLGIGCDCIINLAQALQIMQAQSLPQPRNNNSPPNLETILEDNRKVVARGETLLHCTCFDDSTTIMLFAALIAKHLTFYGTSLTGDNLNSPSDFRPGSSSSTVPTNLTVSTLLSSSSSTTTATTSSRLTIGAYTLDAAGEERLRIKITMMELQKLGSLLGKMRSKMSAALPVGYEGRTYETMVDFLDTRLREATERLRMMKKRLKAEAGGGNQMTMWNKRTELESAEKGAWASDWNRVTTLMSL